MIPDGHSDLRSTSSGSRASCTPRRRHRVYCGLRSAGRPCGLQAVSRMWSGPGASAGSSPAQASQPPQHGRSDPVSVSQQRPPRPNRSRTTPSAAARWSVRFAPSNVSSNSKRSKASQPSRPWRKSAPFRAGYPLVAEALSAPLQGGVRLLRRSFTPSVMPFLAVGIPPPHGGGASGAYPVVQCGDADGEAAPYGPAGHIATVVDDGTRRSDPRAVLAPACQHLWPVTDDGP